MKNIFIKFIKTVFCFSIILGALHSCVRDTELSIKEPTRYTSQDIKSYEDLFKIFWTVMDQKYNYFYEQKREDGMNWDAVYNEYLPKFAALKTYNRDEKYSDQEIKEESTKAVEYFTNIIDPILDRHYNFQVRLPVSKESSTVERFSGGMKSKSNNIYSFVPKFNYMVNLIDDKVIVNQNGFVFLSGTLISNPEIYYITYNQFALSNTMIELNDMYLVSNTSLDNYDFTQSDIENSTSLNAIQDATDRNKVKAFTSDVLNQWSTFFNSSNVSSFNTELKKFKDTEVVADDFVNLGYNLLSTSNSLFQYDQQGKYSSVLNANTKPYITWFMSRIKDYVENGHHYKDFAADIPVLIDKAPVYQQVYNPLHKGDIKKLVIDVRGNGGGSIIDFRNFVERFVTKSTVWGYQRLKEGNGRFNYTPWVPMQGNPHPFGIPTTIPIAILTDKGSYSMSEMSTLMLKTQGSQVVSIGDYSAGATAGLAGSDDFNGGTRDVIANTMSFYMPVMATKDVNGDVIEGIGVKPNIYVTPPTDEEVLAMKNSPKTFVDRVLQEAIKYLSSK